MSDEVKLFLLRHKLRCLNIKKRTIQEEIDQIKEQIIFEQAKLLKEREKRNELKQIKRIF